MISRRRKRRRKMVEKKEKEEAKKDRSASIPHWLKYSETLLQEGESYLWQLRGHQVGAINLSGLTLDPAPSPARPAVRLQPRPRAPSVYRPRSPSTRAKLVSEWAFQTSISCLRHIVYNNTNAPAHESWGIRLLPARPRGPACVECTSDGPQAWSWTGCLLVLFLVTLVDRALVTVCFVGIGVVDTVLHGLTISKTLLWVRVHFLLERCVI